MAKETATDTVIVERPSQEFPGFGWTLGLSCGHVPVRRFSSGIPRESKLTTLTLVVAANQCQPAISGTKRMYVTTGVEYASIDVRSLLQGTVGKSLQRMRDVRTGGIGKRSSGQLEVSKLGRPKESTRVTRALLSPVDGGMTLGASL